MKKTILTTVSVIALMGALPVLAETAKTQSEINAEASTTGNVVEDAKTAIKEIKSDASEAYEAIKATLIGKTANDKNMPVVIDARETASGIIGHPVYNEKYESIAKVTDIILDHNGGAAMIVVTSNAIIGSGKKVAFDYHAVTNIENDDDVIIPLTKGMIDNAASFSYRDNKVGDEMRVIPNNGYSVIKLLEGKLINQKKEAVADIENISFKDGKANQIIVGFDKTFGRGGEKAVLSYSDAKIIRDGEKMDFQLSTEKTEQFEAYKKTVTN